MRSVLTFFVLALAAGSLGFFVLAGVLAGITKLFFLVFLGLVAITLVMRVMRSGDGEELEE